MQSALFLTQWLSHLFSPQLRLQKSYMHWDFTNHAAICACSRDGPFALLFQKLCMSSSVTVPPICWDKPVEWKNSCLRWGVPIPWSTGFSIANEQTYDEEPFRSIAEDKIYIVCGFEVVEDTWWMCDMCVFFTQAWGSCMHVCSSSRMGFLVYACLLSSLSHHGIPRVWTCYER